MTPSSATESCLRRHVLLRYRFGELAGSERAQAEAHLTGCAACQARLAELEAGEQAFLAAADLGRESAQILARVEAQPASQARLRFPRWALRLSFAAGAALILLLALPSVRHLERGGTRAKGGVSLMMYVNEPQGPRAARDGEVLKEGDQIQFRYRANGRRYLFVVSVTEAGELSPLYPDAQADSVPVEPEEQHVLEGSVILDDAQGPERIFALFSDRPLSYAEVQRLIGRRLAEEKDLTRLRSLDVGRDDVEDTSILILKE